MGFLHSLDFLVFRFVNGALSNTFFDSIFPILGHPAWATLAISIIGAALLWKGVVRGLICLAFLLLVLALGDALIVGPLKALIERPRPFEILSGVRVLVMPSHSSSMPSGHACAWSSATMVAFIYYRRSLLFMLPLAVAVGFSRIYNGVHFPSDVLVGSILGLGLGAATVWTSDALWNWVAPKWFALWQQKLPSLMEPGHSKMAAAQTTGLPAGNSRAEGHWLRLGYLVIGISLILRLAYVASDVIQLSEDEAYQWVWSKHLALSYYSKPPLIAYGQWLGTHIWGDNAFGVRFFSPLLAAIGGALLLRFIAKNASARAAFILLLATTTTLLTSAGSVLFTVDPLSVLFWIAAMIAGWRAMEASSRISDWLFVGLWTGLGFLSKYTALFQLACWGTFFLLYPPARRHLRAPGPYLALLVLLSCATPVLLWNAQHAWITVRHVADDAGVGKAWSPGIFEFLGAEVALLNPVFFFGTVWACMAFWDKPNPARGKGGRASLTQAPSAPYQQKKRSVLMLFLFSMGAPVFLIYLALSLQSEVKPNWIAPAVLPLFCLAAVYWEERWRLGEAAGFTRWFLAGLFLGGLMVAFALNTDIIRKVSGYSLPPRIDPHRRVRGWDVTAKVVGEARRNLEREGRPVFIIGNHYGITSQICFYLPEARESLSTNRFVYFISSPYPRNQYFFWEGYTNRTGQNAIFVNEMGKDLKLRTAPQILNREFLDVENLGACEVRSHGKVVRVLQLFACRGLR